MTAAAAVEFGDDVVIGDELRSIILELDFELDASCHLRPHGRLQSPLHPELTVVNGGSTICI